MGHTDAVNCIRYSSDGEWIATGSKDRTIKLWNKAGRLIYTYPRHKREIVDVVFSPEMKYIVTQSEQKIYLWTLNGEKVWESEVKPPPPNSEVTTYSSPSFSKDGAHLLFAKDRSSATIYHIPTKQARTIVCDQSNNLKFSPDGQWVMSTKDGTIILYTKEGEIGVQFPATDPKAPEIQSFEANFLDEFHIAVAYNYAHPDGIKGPEILHQSGGFIRIFNIRGQEQETFGRVLKKRNDG
ncbi:MAG: hypothetical protein AAF242_19200, partial [Bacteroidota bacterium]